MTGRNRFGAILGSVLATLLTGCIPPLDPVVPVGKAGYDALDGAALASPARYMLQAGDVVSIRILDEPELSQDEVAVDNAGNLSLPLIGEIRASGSSASQIALAIERAYGARYLRDPRASVSIKKAREASVSVEGQVNQPGVYPWRSGDTLLTALARARSPTDVARLDQVIVFRTLSGQRYGGRFDLQAIRGGRMPDLLLAPGDVIVVGHSSLRGTYKDILQTAPLVGVLRPL